MKTRSTKESDKITDVYKAPVPRNELDFSKQTSPLLVPAGIYSAKDMVACIRSQAPKIVLTPTHGTVAFLISMGEGEQRTNIDFQTLQAYPEFPPESALLQQMLGFTQRILSPLDSRWYRRLVGAPDNRPVQVQLQHAIAKNPYLETIGVDNNRFHVLSKKPINAALGKQMLTFTQMFVITHTLEIRLRSFCEW